MDPENRFNPMNRVDPGNPANPLDRINLNNLFNPIKAIAPTIFSISSITTIILMRRFNRYAG